MMEYIALFYTHSGAIKYDEFLKKSGITGNLLPVPRKLSSNCGIGARFHYDGQINLIISEDIEKLYEIEEGKYVLIYECD